MICSLSWLLYTVVHVHVLDPCGKNNDKTKDTLDFRLSAASVSPLDCHSSTSTSKRFQAINPFRHKYRSMSSRPGAPSRSRYLSVVTTTIGTGRWKGRCIFSFNRKRNEKGRCHQAEGGVLIIYTRAATPQRINVCRRSAYPCNIYVIGIGTVEYAEAAETTVPQRNFRCLIDVGDVFTTAVRNRKKTAMHNRRRRSR